MLPLVCHVKYHLNARATEILAHTVDSCFETTNMSLLHLLRLKWKSTVEKYSFSFGTAGKGLQYLVPYSVKELHNDLLI